MKGRLTFLLEKYLNRDISQEEKAELFGYIGDEKNKEFLQETIEMNLEGRGEPVPGKDELYQIILTRNNIIPRQTWWKKRRSVLTGVAATVLLVVSTLWFSQEKIRTADLSTQETGAKLNGHQVYGENEFVSLPDGSTVTLSSKSELKALYKDGLFTRQVVLKGEAFFDIKPDTTQTFVVYSGKVSTRVLGTSFYIRALEEQTEVTVTRGVVEVSRAEKTYGKLTANEQLTIHNRLDESHVQLLTDPDLEQISADLLLLVFDESPLNEILKRLEQKFGYTISLENKDIERCRISASFLNGESLEDILDLICQMRHASYEKKGTHIIIKQGKSCG